METSEMTVCGIRSFTERSSCSSNIDGCTYRLGLNKENESSCLRIRNLLGISVFIFQIDHSVKRHQKFRNEQYPDKHKQ
uniref:Uncharacterized protein n=1 Tax=Onchocerca volvulus TaxID=6282 RepID=A0A8R1XRK8_ONCVO